MSAPIVRCIYKPGEHTRQSWCGKQLNNWHFINIDHARTFLHDHYELVVCCYDCMIKAINHVREPNPTPLYSRGYSPGSYQGRKKAMKIMREQLSQSLGR